MDESFIRTKLALLELGELGYREVWLGNVPNPHWGARAEGCLPMDNFLIAAPKRLTAGWPSLWAASDRNFGRMGCGNGLKEADQCQRELVRRMIPGYYFLEDGRWVPGRFYQDYVRANGRAETTAVMESIFYQAGPCTDFLRLAVHYASDYGRLPDHMHAALVLTGSEFASRYLVRIDKPKAVG